MLDSATLNAIGRQLRLMYDALGRPLPADRPSDAGRGRPAGQEHARHHPARPGRDAQGLDAVRLPR